MTLPLATVFTDVPDPRRQTKNTKHQLTDILVIATCAVLAGAQTWDAIALYGADQGGVLPPVPDPDERHPEP